MTQMTQKQKECFMFFTDHMSEISDEIHNISELLYAVGENIDEDLNGRDVNGMLSFLARNLERVRGEMNDTVKEMNDAGMIRF